MGPKRKTTPKAGKISKTAKAALRVDKTPKRKTTPMTAKDIPQVDRTSKRETTPKTAKASPKVDKEPPPSHTKSAGDGAGAQGNSADEDDDRVSVSSDWVPWMRAQGDHAIDQYLDQRSAISDFGIWFEEQKKLHQLLWMRGHHPLMPRTWEYNFLMWGLPQKLYRKAGIKTRVALSNKGDEYRATKAIEPLMDLTIKIADYDRIEKPEKTKELIVKALHNYIDWAEEDAGVADKKVIPVVEVYHYSSSFGFRPEENVKEEQPGWQSPLEEQEHEKLLDNIQADIELRMRRLAAWHRDNLADDIEPTGWTYMPPILFAYAVIHNVVIIVCHDSSDPDAPVSVLEHLSLASPSQWLWNALTLAIPIHFARDHLYMARGFMKDKDPAQMDLDDPDE